MLGYPYQRLCDVIFLFSCHSFPLYLNRLEISVTYSETVMTSDPEVGSRRRVHSAALYHSTRPDLCIRICHCRETHISKQQGSL